MHALGHMQICWGDREKGPHESALCELKQVRCATSSGGKGLKQLLRIAQVEASAMLGNYGRGNARGTVAHCCRVQPSQQTPDQARCIGVPCPTGVYGRLLCPKGGDDLQLIIPGMQCKKIV